MSVRAVTIAVAAALAFAPMPSWADIPPPDQQPPKQVPLPTPDRLNPKPAPAPAPQPPRPAPQEDSAAPFIAAGFFAMFALLWLWFVRGSRGRAA